MIFKKFRGQIFDVELTKKEQQVLDEKINQRILEQHTKFADDVDYMILYILHRYFGFGLKRLRKVYDLVRQENEALTKHYESTDAGVFIARKEMNAIGCNVEEWNRERSN
jgi:hypothetical protein